ncbi:hypothetical protein [Streptomyces europaeiscabiei]|uniref:hypothetical protein n=1 Tax=Streptomyces europaeiscabiei TaxID=146819 RepID=UPI002E1417FA|nr:hypothetical protein OHB30_28260 [Streptomyces europaeiscabiei]
MGIGMRRTAIASTTALLLCLGTMGTASADQDAPEPSANGSDQAAGADVVDAADTVEINDRDGWEDDVTEAIPTPFICSGPETWIETKNKKNYHIPSWWNGTKYKDGPGGTMTVSVTRSGTITAEVTGTVEAEANLVIAAAKSSISYKIAGSVTVATGHTYSRNIPKRKYGHLQYGSWGYKVSWEEYRRKGNGCGRATLIDSGTATLPTKETGWKFWSTSS